MEARLYAQEEVIFETERAIRFPVESKTAVFSLPVPLPSTAWNGDLVGMLTLHPTDSTILPASLTFTVSCKAVETPPAHPEMRSTPASESLPESEVNRPEGAEDPHAPPPLGPLPEFQAGRWSIQILLSPCAPGRNWLNFQLQFPPPVPSDPQLLFLLLPP
ncbi:MAG: hypothetical protein HC921_13150 [Synechococcaceae cyanobacterium SM2_3_1]|nr:hypothetical protein [Synechococcaceae cyanobacterium SM2_3_1]